MTVQPIRDRQKLELMRKVLDSPRDRLLFTLGINTALRIQDILEFCIQDIADEKGNLKEFKEVEERKTGKVRVFPFSRKVKKAIRDYLKTLHNPRQSDYVFKSRKGKNKRISRVQAWRIINTAAKKIGIEERVGTHSLRKSWCYHYLKNGGNLTTAQHVLNHSHPAITLTYSGITQDEVNEAILSLDL